MANKARPRCPKCGLAMIPVYHARVRGNTFATIKNTFWCATHDIIARGRRKPNFV